MNFEKNDIVFGWYSSSNGLGFDYKNSDRWPRPHRYVSRSYENIKPSYYHKIEDVLLTHYAESNTRKQKIFRAKVGTVIDCGRLSGDSFLVLKRLSQEEIDIVKQLSENSKDASSIRSEIYKQTKALQEALRDKEKKQRVLLKEYPHLVVIEN